MNILSLGQKNIGGIFLVFFLSASSSFGITINVPGDQPTIAAAVTAAHSGDIIVIAPGTYIEPKTILINKQLTISSQWRAAGEPVIAQTVLDGKDKSHTLFETVNNLGVNVEISGLTFTRFKKPIVINDSAVIQKNVFTNNSSDSISFEPRGFGYAGFNTIEDSSDDGIDIDATEGSFTIEFNTIRNNGDDGIEIRLFTGSQPNMSYAIHDNILSGNHEDGLQLIDYSNNSGRVFDIYNNVFDNNAMAGLGCMPGGNTTENFGGANIAERVNFHNNTVINNAVGITGGDNFIALNNIIANNANEGVKRLRVDSVLAHSIFYNNGTHISDAITDTGILLDVNPQYDPVTYQLLAGSPGIDSGVATLLWNGEQVLNLDFSQFLGSAPDLGAKEFGSGGSAENTAPTVHAGSDQLILHPADSLALLGQISDDGLPNPPGAVTTVWRQGAGPGTITFDDASSLETTAIFPAQGKYQLSLTADDGDKTASDSMIVRYVNDGSGNTVAIQSSGTTFFEAEDYAYLYGTAQKINDVDASGAMAIQSSEGAAAEAHSEHILSVTDQNITFYMWIRAKSADQNSASIFVSIMDAPETEVPLSSDNSYHWFQVPGNFMLEAGSWPLIIRAGESGGIWDQAAFTTDPGFVPGINQPPTVDAGTDQSIALANNAALVGTVADDGLPSGSTVTATWSQVSGPGIASFADAQAVDTTASFSAAGTYILRLTADDTQLTVSDELSITVNAGPIPTHQWHFDETSGTAAADAAGTNNATLTNVAWVAGKSGNAAAFNGTNASGNVGEIDFGTGNFTVAHWIKVDGFKDFAGIFNNRSSASKRVGFHTRTDGTGTLKALIDFGTTSRSLAFSNAVPGIWYHVAVSVDRAGLMQLYVNGVLSGQVDIAAFSAITLSHPDPVRLGRDQASNYFSGAIDELRLYDSALSAQEIQKLYNE